MNKDDLELVENLNMLKNILLLLNSSTKIFVLKPLDFRKLSCSEIQNDALMHREGLTLSSLNLPLSFHTLQVANCDSNSRLVVDEDDLKWVKN